MRVILFTMIRRILNGLLLTVVFLAHSLPLEAGTPIRLHGSGFSFELVEPEGWAIDLESAAQIANFVLTEQGVAWRRAEVSIFGRFVRKEESLTLEEFVRQDVDLFEESCPLFEIEPVRLEVDGAHSFTARAFDCAGSRHEVVAVTETPSFFIVFVLSARHKDLIPPSMDAFRTLLASFQWREHSGFQR